MRTMNMIIFCDSLNLSHTRGYENIARKDKVFTIKTHQCCERPFKIHL